LLVHGSGSSSSVLPTMRGIEKAAKCNKNNKNSNSKYIQPLQWQQLKRAEKQLQFNLNNCRRMAAEAATTTTQTARQAKVLCRPFT